tara:strand:+ start:11072 stop:11191 length:120 start_codon:yes stop_codon:yes gene_type:complete
LPIWFTDRLLAAVRGAIAAPDNIIYIFNFRLSRSGTAQQ